MQKNVFGGELKTCCKNPLTGFYRTGSCETGADDVGLHTVCVKMTAAFLEFSKLRGNDLSTPRPEYGFAGLKAGDRWCVCVLRWKEAVDAGFPAPIHLASTNVATLKVVHLEDLMKYAIEEPSQLGE
jgi:uncharacterized protein (DUF2237 family)